MNAHAVKILNLTSAYATPDFPIEAHELFKAELKLIENSIDRRSTDGKALGSQIDEAIAQYDKATAARKKVAKQVATLNKAAKAAMGKTGQPGKYSKEYEDLVDELKKTVQSDDEDLQRAIPQRKSTIEARKDCSTCFENAYGLAEKTVRDFESKAESKITVAKNTIETSKEIQVQSGAQSTTLQSAKADEIAFLVTQELANNEAFMDELATRTAQKLTGLKPQNGENPEESQENQ